MIGSGVAGIELMIDGFLKKGNEWTDGWIDRRMDRWTDARTSKKYKKKKRKKNYPFLLSQKRVIINRCNKKFF